MNYDLNLVNVFQNYLIARSIGVLNLKIVLIYLTFDSTTTSIDLATYNFSILTNFVT